MGDRKTYLINQIVKYSQKLDEKGFSANHDGNISALFEDIILATPTAVSKGNINADMIITLDREGKKLAGFGAVFSEKNLHLAAYTARSDAKAVVHAHPPFSMAYGLINRALYPQVPEAIVSIGDIIPVVPFAMPGAKENDAIIAEALSKVDVFIMPGNGVLSIGDSIEQAYLRLELVEHIAKMQYYAEQLSGSAGAIMQLAPEDRQSLLKKRASLGLGPKQPNNHDIGQSTSQKQSNSTLTALNAAYNADFANALKKLIADEIKKIL